jgi:hypothetical protein
MLAARRLGQLKGPVIDRHSPARVSAVFTHERVECPPPSELLITMGELGRLVFRNFDPCLFEFTSEKVIQRASRAIRG